MHVLRNFARFAACLAVLWAIPAGAQTLRMVAHSDLKVLDPIWTTAFITRNHGYMVYDVLFARDADLRIQPQMVDKYEVSADKLSWKFTLRDGLEWHDGKPVTAEDCVASIRRWAARDALGQQLMASVGELIAVDAKTFTMTLKEPFGLVLEALGKPSSNVPFMMPKRVAETDPNRSTTTPARARSSSRRTSGSPARRWSTPRTPSTSRVPSRPRCWPAARW